MSPRNKRVLGRPILPLDGRHYYAIELLVQGRYDYTEVAEQTGVSRRTLYRWRQRKDFKREINKELKRKARERQQANKERMSVRTLDDLDRIFRACDLL
jgi:transposase-like protein